MAEHGFIGTALTCVEGLPMDTNDEQTFLLHQPLLPFHL